MSTKHGDTLKNQLKYLEGVLTDSELDEVRKILSVWHKLFGLQPDWEGVAVHLAALRQRQDGRPRPKIFFHLPDDLELLSESLTLEPATVSAMLDRGEIPVRHAVDKNGRLTGRRAVLLLDARRAIEGRKTSGEIT